jgi:signal transduction histidine kinase
LQARQEGSSLLLQQRLSAATELAKEGLQGARQAVDSLHNAAATTSAGPLEEWLQGTVVRLRTASDARITVVGEATAIPDVWRESARAVLREALTNSVRHAPELPVRITLADNEIRVLTVGDVSAIPRTEQVSGGHGLAGLRRRVEAGGGRFDAGATADGWLVVARWEQA